MMSVISITIQNETKLRIDKWIGRSVGHCSVIDVFILQKNSGAPQEDLILTILNSTCNYILCYLFKESSFMFPSSAIVAPTKFKLFFIAAPTEIILEMLMLNDGLGHI